MKKNYVLMLFLLLLNGSLFAQSKTLENIEDMDIRSQGYILENNTVEGYFVFYKADDVDKKNNSYILALYDNNFSFVKNIQMVRLKGTVVLEIVFNGEAFLISFFDGKDQALVTYDKKGKQLGQLDIKTLTAMERMQLKQSKEQGAVNYTIHPMEKTGFVRQQVVKNDKYGYLVTAYDNNMKELWRAKSDENSKEIEVADIMTSDNNYVSVSLMKKSGMMSKKFDTYYMLIDAKTGKTLFTKAMQDQSDLSLMNVTIDDKSKNVVLTGEYFAPGDDQGNSKSQGMYFMVTDMSGERVEFKKLSWTKELAKVLTEDNGKKTKYTIAFHKFIHTADNKWFAIGELYKKAVSGLGVASAMLSGGRGGASVASIFLTDMVLLEFDPKFNLVDAKNIPKRKSEVMLPQGAEYYSAAFLVNILRAMGEFDYEFTTTDKDVNSFYCIYTDNDRKGSDGKKNDRMVGSISYEDGKIKTNRFPLNTEGNAIFLSPAKPGYIAVKEYFRKKRTLYMHLEKVNY